MRMDGALMIIIQQQVEWYREAAESGHTGAQFNLGVMYENGRGVDKDDSSAVEWYRQAAEQGHTGAQNYLDRLTFYSSDTGLEEE